MNCEYSKKYFHQSSLLQVWSDAAPSKQRIINPKWTSKRNFRASVEHVSTLLVKKVRLVNCDYSLSSSRYHHHSNSTQRLLFDALLWSGKRLITKLIPVGIFSLFKFNTIHPSCISLRLNRSTRSKNSVYYIIPSREIDNPTFSPIKIHSHLHFRTIIRNTVFTHSSTIPHSMLCLPSRVFVSIILTQYHGGTCELITSILGVVGRTRIWPTHTLPLFPFVSCMC